MLGLNILKLIELSKSNLFIYCIIKEIFVIFFINNLKLKVFLFNSYWYVVSYNFEFYDELNSLPMKVNVTFSSYPGCVSSTDDFYITDKKLMVTETTLEVIDMNAYKKVKGSSLFIPNFMRINAATFFSNSGVK